MTGSVGIIEPGSFVIDYSWNNIWMAPSIMTDHGVKGVCRYHSFDASKDLGGIGPAGSESQRDQEIEMLASVGLGIIPNWEANTAGPLGGYSAGQRHGRECFRQLQIAGCPVGTPCIASFDFDVQPSQYGIADDYTRGFFEQCPGYDRWIYGHDKIVTHQYEQGLLDGAWQCQAWSYGRRSPYTDILQYARNPVLANTDDNVVLKPSRFWFPGGTDNPPPPPHNGGVVQLATHVCFASNAIGMVEIVLCADGRHRWQRVGEAHATGAFYAVHPGGAGVNPVGDNELNDMGQYNAANDAYWQADRYKERGLGSGGGGTVYTKLTGTIQGTLSQ